MQRTVHTVTPITLSSSNTPRHVDCLEGMIIGSDAAPAPLPLFPQRQHYKTLRWFQHMLACLVYLCSSRRTSIEAGRRAFAVVFGVKSHMLGWSRRGRGFNRVQRVQGTRKSFGDRTPYEGNNGFSCHMITRHIPIGCAVPK